MPESELLIMVDNDDDSVNSKDMDSSSTSPNSTKTKRTRLTFPFGACRVCSDSATGIHYGIATCEGCKGFFKRSILRKEKYRCYFDNTCLINVTNRNRCKACRFRRCIDEGMSVDGVKMGRIPKLVKERALKALKEQQMKEEAALAETNEEHARTSSCSSVSDGSIENYDPNPMEIDSIPSRIPPIQRHNDLTNAISNENYEKKAVYSTEPISDKSSSSSLIYRTNYPTFLPADFTVDETEGLQEQATGFLNPHEFQHVKTISDKLSYNSIHLTSELNEEEFQFIRYLRWSALNIYLRRSKRLKQMVSRMNQMIEKNIQEYPGENATLAEYYNSIRLSCQVYIRANVVYAQELPGMKNIHVESLAKTLSHRSLDWHILKHHQLYHRNGESYFLGPDGFQHTCQWMSRFQGIEFTNQVFQFSERLQQLNLTDGELALVLPLHLCYSDTSMEDQDTPRMLRSCYLYALYRELHHNRGEQEGKKICSKILQLLESLIPLVEIYQREVASRIFEVSNLTDS